MDSVDTAGSADTAGGPDGAAARAAACCAAYAVAHHLGSWLAPLGEVGGAARTRWQDWADLAVPFVVLVPAALALAAARPARRVWAVFGVGAVLYVEGHGIHLAANSVANVAPGPTAHLWDEVVGHWLWYSGWFVVAGCLLRVLGDRPAPARRGLRAAAGALAVAVGVTAATNAVGGGTVPLAAAAALAAGWYGLRRPDRLRGYGVVAAAAALAALPVAALTG